MTDPIRDFGQNESGSSSSDGATRRARRVDSLPGFSPGGVIFDAPDHVPAVWGHGDDVLWAEGEPLMVFGPQGVGKTTLVQQLALMRAGDIDEPSLLGLPVAPDPDRHVLYLAMDRPRQAERSMRRMLDSHSRVQRSLLNERLRLWKGPLPFKVTDDPPLLAEWLVAHNIGRRAVRRLIEHEELSEHFRDKVSIDKLFDGRALPDFS